VHAGNITRERVELVIVAADSAEALFKGPVESSSWAWPLRELTTVYSSELPQLALTTHYLRHLVQRYDTLAEWTVFMPANATDCKRAADIHGESDGSIPPRPRVRDRTHPCELAGLSRRAQNSRACACRLIPLLLCSPQRAQVCWGTSTHTIGKLGGRAQRRPSQPQVGTMCSCHRPPCGAPRTTASPRPEAH
jgi:hypothetical protein